MSRKKILLTTKTGTVGKAEGRQETENSVMRDMFLLFHLSDFFVKAGVTILISIGIVLLVSIGASRLSKPSKYWRK